MHKYLQVGQLVISKCGRDRENYFLVVECDDEYGYLVDGRIRTLSKPKKKKIKHISTTNKISDDILEKITEKRYINDSDIRKSIELLK